MNALLGRQATVTLSEWDLNLILSVVEQAIADLSRSPEASWVTLTERQKLRREALVNLGLRLARVEQGLTHESVEVR